MKPSWYLINFCISILFTKALELTVVNVGQGNCNLIAFEKGAPPILYDAGTDSRPFDKDGKQISKLKIVDQISNSIKKVKYNPNKHVNIIISHGDRDHHNYIMDVIKSLPDHTFNVYLGGRKDQYYKKDTTQFIKLIDGLRKYPKVWKGVTLGEKKLFAADYPNNQLPMPPVPENFSVECLASLTNVPLSNGKLPDKNDVSLVIKVTNLSTNRAILLTGDATNETTATISHDKLGNIDVLVCNHHGAKDDCNNKKWIEAVNPLHVIFSAGLYTHLHPRPETVQRYIDYGANIGVGKLHEFSYSSAYVIPKIPHFATVVQKEKVGTKGWEYNRALTRLSLHNTIDEGRLHFTARRKIISERELFDGYLIKRLVLLNLSHICLDNLEFIKILTRLRFTALTKLDVSSNHLDLTKEEARDKLFDFVRRAKGHLKSINVSYNPIYSPQPFDGGSAPLLMEEKALILG